MSIEDLKLQTVDQLKALAYDQTKLLQMSQQNLQIIESILSEKLKKNEPKTEVEGEVVL